jgi:hypothetical protein
MSKLILLLAFFLTPQDPPQKCAISGTVVDALTGHPLNKVAVSVDTRGEPYGEPAASAITDSKGTFTITGLDPARYFPAASRNGYLETYYGARRPGGGKTAIALDPGQDLKDITLKLFPYAVVAGVVHDPDGEPLSGVTVTAWAVQFGADGKSFQQAAEMVADGLGQYRIPGLEPGKYYLRAELDTRGVLVNSFYPGVPDPDAATMVEVGLGARIAGLDIAMPRPRAFRVTVRIAAPPGFEAHCWLSSGRDEYTGYADYTSLVRGYIPSSRQHGQFVFSRVPAGSYTVRANASPPADCPKGMDWCDTVAYSASPRLDVTNSDIDDFRVNLTAGAAIHAHFTVEGDAKTPVEGGALHFRGAGAKKFLEDQRLSTMLSIGHYVVEFDGLPSGLYVKSIRSGSTDVLRDGLTVAGSGAIPLELILSDEVGALDGVVLDKDDKPVPGATLVLIPEAALRSHPGLFYTAVTDQYGRYRLKDLAPGEYKAVAWDDVKPNSWFDPDFLKPLESAAEAVTVAPKGHDTLKLHVQL